MQINNTQEQEIIICAAIWYKDLPNQHFMAINQDRGIIVLGHRHGYCIDIVKQLSNLRSVKFADDGVGESVQGFLTNKNRFLDRKEAHELFKVNGCTPEFKDELYSEDLY